MSILGCHWRSGARPMDKRVRSLRREPPEGWCVGCIYLTEKDSLASKDIRLCFYYCWKLALDHRRKENKRVK
jgi:hypothetical protein